MYVVRKSTNSQISLSGIVRIVRCLFGVAFRYDRIVARWIHSGLSMQRRSSAGHGHRHWHLLHGLRLLLRGIRLRRVSTGSGVVAWHRLGHALRYRRSRLMHRVHSGPGAVLLHYDPTRSPGSRTGVHVHRIGTYVVLRGCDHYRGCNHCSLVSPSPAAHPAQ